MLSARSLPLALNWRANFNSIHAFMPTNTDSPSAEAILPDDSSLVDDNELLMRRIRKRLGDYDSTRSPPLQESAFLPSKHDDTGLSLNRRVSEDHPGFLTPIGLIEACPVPSIRETCGVIEILTEAARRIGLQVIPKPASTPGHVEIPEINYPEFEGAKSTEGTRAQIRIWVAQLIEVASVLIPPGKRPKLPDE